MTIDPTLRLDLLAKLQQIEVEPARRSLFDFSAPPAPKMPEPKIVPGPAAAPGKPEQSGPGAPAPAPAKPPPPPIRLKFYGFVSPVNSGGKRAFFLDGEDIFVAAEGDVIRKRYKIVRIGVNSAVVRDTEHDNEQTIKLEEQLG
jgi:hypothetical protein